MAMSVGGNNGGPSSDINVTPLIDVLLVLIIIFMVITPHGLNALVPQPPKHPEKPNPSDDRTIVVQVLDGGVLKINETPETWDQLGTELGNIYKTRAEKVMFVKADDDIPFAQVARVIDITQGVDPSIKVGLMTKKIAAGQ
jgi:biopolymer transport protein ExbD